MSNLQQKQVVINNILINYYQHLNSEKPVLLFLHGWRSEGIVWKNIVERLSSDYNIYALDLPGFGKSQTPDKDFNLKDYSDLVINFINKFNLKKVNIIGHSFGGRIVIKLASNNPNYVHKIILVNSAGVYPPSSLRSIKKLIAKILKPIFKLPFLKNTRKTIYKILGAEDYLATPQLQKIFVNIISEDLTSLLKKIKIPVLLIWGDKDKDTPINQARTMEQLISNSKLVVLENAGHFSFLDKQDEFIVELEKFLK